MGGVRRVPRLSNATVHAPPAISEPVLTANWTIQKTTTYNSALPADAPVAWGGTLTALDRTMVSTGSGYAALGALITWVNKPDSIAGVVMKIQPTYSSVELPFLEMWTLDGAEWTKRNRIPLSAQVRSGDTYVVDFTTTIYEADTVDAMWITLVPSGTETLTWLVLHTYGVCNTDSNTPTCPPGVAPADCDDTECDTDPTTWLATAGCTPVLLPGEVLVQMPQTYTFATVNFHHNHACPDPTTIWMNFTDLSAGCSVVVDVVDSHGVQLSATSGGAAITSQTISAPGFLYWWVVAGTGYAPTNTPAAPNYLPPYDITPYMKFRFTRSIDGAVVNLLEPLTFFWTNAIGYNEPC